MNRRRNTARKRRNSLNSQHSGSIASCSLVRDAFVTKKRKDNSLVELTKNFIEYIKTESPNDHIIQISKMVKKLKVKKRRIYDITNVLEGIGYIRKLEKNKILLLDDRLDNPESSPIRNIENNSLDLQMKLKELESLEKSENDLQEWHNNLKFSLEKMTEDEDFKENAYISFDDLKKLSSKEDVNFIAVKAQKGTMIEIPEPENVEKIYNQTLNNINSNTEKYDHVIMDTLEKKYQVLFDSPNGEISVYLVTNNSQNEEKNNFNDFSYNFNNNFNVPKTKNLQK